MGRQATIIAFFGFAAVLLLFSQAAGEEMDLEGLFEAPDEEVAAYMFPEIPPEGAVCVGFKYADSEGSRSALEYEHLEDSPSVCGELRAFKHPHRFHFEGDFITGKEYFSDLRYAYRDVVLFRWLNRSLFHNLENISLVDLDPATSAPGVDVRDSNEIYGAQVETSKYDLRLKAPDYPLHGFFSGWSVNKEGTEQQISLLGSGDYNNIVVTSRERDIDFETDRYTLGANSHLGPFEAEYAHTEKSFSSDGEDVAFDFYEASAYLPEGVYAHDAVPDFEGSIDSVKLHTSYAGRLVASATFTNKESTNTDSGASADYFIGSGGVYWMPLTRLLFTLEYSRVDTDADNPSTATTVDASDPANSFTYDVKPSVSSTTDTVSLTGKYRPLSRLSLKARYSYKETDRSEAEDWGLEGSTSRQTALLSATARLLSNLTANASFKHEAVEDPSYATELETSDEGQASLTWTPLPEVNAFLSYVASGGKTDEMSLSDEADAEDRSVRSDNVTGVITFLLKENLAMSASYSYFMYNIEQDIVYDSLGGVDLVDPDVELKDTARVYALNMDYTPREALALGAGVAYTRGKGEFTPESGDLTEPESVASFSEFEVAETSYTVTAGYRFRKGFAVDAEYTYSNLNDELDNPYDDIEDGDAHVIIVKLSKRWL